MNFGKSLVCKYVSQLLTLPVILSKLLELTALWFSYLNNKHNNIYLNRVIERIKGNICQCLALAQADTE